MNSWIFCYLQFSFVLAPVSEVLNSCCTRTLAAVLFWWGRCPINMSSLLSLGGSPGGRDSLPSIFTAGSGDRSFMCVCPSVVWGSGSPWGQLHISSPPLYPSSSQLICCDNHDEPWWRNTPFYPQRYILCHKFISGSLVVFLATKSLSVSSVA